MKKETIDIKYILVPIHPDDDKEYLPEPDIRGYQMITWQRVLIDGKEYDKYEYIPDQINLCCGGNGKRIRGNKIRILEEIK